MTEGGTKKSSSSASVTIHSPEVSSRSTSNWHELNIRPPRQDSEQRKYWEYRNIYNIPVPQGIEFWADEDKKRWEMINIGGLDESEANRRITKAKLQSIRARQQQRRNARISQGTDKLFIVPLMFFGLQIIIGTICIGFSIHQMVINNQIQASMAFLILGLMPLFGAIGGIFTIVMKSESIALSTIIYNVTSAIGIIVAFINIYSFKIYESDILGTFLPMAGITAFIQTVSFGVILIIYLNMSSPITITHYRRRIPAAESTRSYRRHQRSMGSRTREKMEREMNAKAEDVTRKYKQYLQKKKQTEEAPEKQEGSRQGSSRTDFEKKDANNEPSSQDNFDTRNSAKSSSIEIRQNRKIRGRNDNSMNYA